VAALQSTSANEVGPHHKRFRVGTERMVDPSATLRRIKPWMDAMGITRMANITGLDRIGIPVVTACRPNSRSLSVSQGKGLTLEAAQASALMEAIEGYHAERVAGPLLWGSYREMRSCDELVDLAGIPRCPAGGFHENLPLLWMAGTDLFSGRSVLVPYETTHLDFRRPLPPGSGAFLMSSNGLASGNDSLEALSHGICELVERDANTLWHLGGREACDARRVDLTTVDDEECRLLLDRFEDAGIGVAVWDTTSDVGIPSLLCMVADRDPNGVRPMPPVGGSGCHPRRAIALLRALTEAAQGRLTIISGSRDDLSPRNFDASLAAAEMARFALELRRHSGKSFGELPDAAHDTFEADVHWELQRLARAGLRQAIAIDLTKREFGIPVIRVIVPYLEAMSELPGFVPGCRGRRVLSERNA
jgi:YcaO-like protein with predicted kinase domain